MPDAGWACDGDGLCREVWRVEMRKDNEKMKV
jgi:hypothetical protein